MLDSIEIRNYKNIDKLLKLENTTNVNYLAGLNASGKTVTLLAISKLVDARSKDNKTLKQTYLKGMEPNQQKLRKPFLKFGFKDKDTKYNTEITSIKQGKQTIWKIISKNTSKRHIPKIKILPNQQKDRGYIKHNLYNILTGDEYEQFIKSIKNFLPDYQDCNNPNKTKKRENLEVEKSKWINKREKINLSMGEKFILRVISELFRAGSKNIDSIFLIEEPENGMHPKWQKQIPHALQEIITFFEQKNKQKPNIQIFVTTHSPFIITEIAKLGETEFEKTKRPNSEKRNFLPTQKIYLLENGHCKNSKGLWSYKAMKLATKMLGAGLVDFVPNINKENQGEKQSEIPFVIICEGAKNNRDAKFYNKIFKNYLPRVLFVSSTGKSQAESSFELISQIKNGLYSDFELLFLRDRDENFPTNQQLKKYLVKNPKHRVLKKRAIECYIYNQENLKNLCKQKKWIYKKEWEAQINKAQENIDKSIMSATSGYPYKIELKSVFRKILTEINEAEIEKIKIKYPKEEWQNKISKLSALNNLSQMLSNQIKPETKTYLDLRKCIFQK